jgi:predicted cupin superfamily sugar epimerase
MTAQTAAALIARLGLQPHPEGGWYRETWRHDPGDGQRGAGTAIYFLLTRGQRSAWHRVDATEIWHFYAGAPLQLHLADDVSQPSTVLLGNDLDAGQLPQRIVAAHQWQAAETTGDFTLVGCTVSPAFEFRGFEMVAAPLPSVQAGTTKLGS